MMPDKRFTGLPKNFWALVRLIGQECGYAVKGQITIPDRKDVESALSKLILTPSALDSALPDGRKTWITLLDYFSHRRDVLHKEVEPNLMDAAEAKREFTKLKRALKPSARCR